MNAREWKPGDVAMVRYKLMGEWREDMRVRAEHPPLGSEVWWGLNGWIGDSTAKEARPLVVIDPDDRAQVERLVVAHCRAYCCDPAPLQPEEVAIMQDALREFANPKPVEPTGLGAVVEDASQVEYIHLGSGLWAYGTTDGPSQGFSWADIDVVRVLSEGVTQ